MATGKVPLIFRLYKGDQFIREEQLTQPVIKVGKLSSSHLRLDDDSVSRMHAVIEVTSADDISIIDLGSTKGTFVNGQKVNKAKLQAGDSIVVGDTRIDVSIGVEAQEQAPMAAASAVASDEYVGQVVGQVPGHVSAPFATSTSAPPAFTSHAGAGGMPAPGFGEPVAAPPRVHAPSVGGYAAPVAAVAAAPMFHAEMADPSGARAVEVAAMLGDSVVSVKHVMNSKGGKTSGAAMAFFGIGAVMLLAAAYSFIVSFNNAASNKAAYDQWTNVEGAPAEFFRLEFISPAFSFIMIAGLVLGIAMVAAGLSKRHRDRESSPFFRIGQAPEVEFPTAMSPSPSFAMVAPSGNDFVFNFVPGMEGELSLDGQSTSLADLQAQGRARPSATETGALEMAIPANGRFRVKNGGNTFLISSVAQPRRQPTPLFASTEAGVWIYFGATAAVLGGLVFILLFGLYDEVLDGDASLEDGESIAANTSAAANDDPPPPEQPDEETADSEDESGGTGTAMALDEGKMGKKDSDRAEGQYKMAKTQDQEQLARTAAIDAAATAGILGSTMLSQGGAFASITATGDISSGFDDVNVMGGLLGTEAGEMNGGFGFGRSGVGPGGGGTGWGTIGTGRYGTIGHGSGTGSGYGTGSGRGSGGGRTAAVPPVRVGEPNVSGDLDREIIKRYIKRNLSRISYCYEKELMAKPGLAGVVKTTFLIAANGAVQASKGDGVDGNVSSCVAGVIKGIKFPAPNGGGGVQVNYPFTFRPSGG